MKILIVEDDLEISKLLADFLQGNGYEVLCQYDGLHVLDCIQEHQIDLILLDIMLPYLDDMEKVAAALSDAHILVTGLSVAGDTLEDYFLSKIGGTGNVKSPKS